MVDEVEARRLAARIIRRAQVEQHREAVRSKALERRTRVRSHDALDTRVGDVGADRGGIERGRAGRRCL